jgi:hypothetical protein
MRSFIHYKTGAFSENISHMLQGTIQYIRCMVVVLM